MLPILVGCFLVNYLDRINVSFAALTMSADLGLSDAAYGFGAGVFFLGYFLFEVPSNLALYKVGPRLWFARIVLSWGAVSAATALVRDPWHFYLVRFLLGVAEAGFFPGVMLYITWWFPVDLRARIVGLFLLGVPVAGILGGPVSGWILESFAEFGGLHGWQWLFLLESAPCLLLTIWVWQCLPDRPRDASWLSGSEKVLVESTISLEEESRGRLGAPDTIRGAFRRPVVWKLCATYFCSAMGLYGLSFWMPQIIREFGVKTPIDIGLYSMIPWAVAAVVMLMVGASSDRTGERRWHAIVSSLVAAVGFSICLVTRNPVLDMAGISIAAAGVMSIDAVQWAMPAAALNASAAAAGVALINSFGNLGGFFSPTLIGFISQRTGSPELGQSVTIAAMVLAACIIFVCRSLQPPRLRGKELA
ncbi:MFS transporter [Terrimicrobium sacchariphilum]|uniref:MFS transporter n=1 Tax=Terrimicrobium sacchariphilum TaxID=690879 RepID=UPI001EDC89C0|nr:MFS transporter [Terrimicrobium sacchariphilum]